VTRALALIGVGLVLAGCGAGADDSAPPTLPAAALPDLAASAHPLDAEALAGDAFDQDELKSLLEEAGFLAGSEREFSGKTTTFDHVVARSLRFGDAEGADAYLGWLAGHGEDLLGRAAPAKIAPPGESGVALALIRCSTCKKELPTFLAGWRRGEVVYSLLAAGPGANAATFSALARKFDSAVA
jgi:hypothetical protein